MRRASDPRCLLVVAVILLLSRLSAPMVLAMERQPNSPAQPNIVIILADDLGYGDVSCYPDHGPDVHTPNIDRLAEAGIRFSNGYASAPNCAPSRAGLLTGRYQQRYGFYVPADSRIGLPQQEITLAEVLKKVGYTTGIFGKWHLGISRAYSPVERGFDEFYGFLGHGAHDYFDLTIHEDRLFNAIRRSHAPIDDTGYLTFNLTREGVSFIKRHRDEPFFLYLAYSAPHWPLQAPEEYIARHGSGRKERDIYLAMVECMDQGIGELINALKETGVYDNTLIFFLSDNGGAKRNHAHNGILRDFKQSMYEGGIRVPFIVVWPGMIAAGKVCDVPVVCQDIFTTAIVAAGAALPGDRIIDGKDLLPVLRGESSAPVHRHLFWAQPKGGGRFSWAIREGDWKLVQENGELELYHLGRDPSEKNDLAGRETARRKDLLAAFGAWRGQMAPQMSQRPQ